MYELNCECPILMHSVCAIGPGKIPGAFAQGGTANLTVPPSFFIETFNAT